MFVADPQWHCHRLLDILGDEAVAIGASTAASRDQRHAAEEPDE
jgi:hypothetical protein